MAFDIMYISILFSIKFFENHFLFTIGVAEAPFLESRVATRVSRQCGSGPGGQEIQESTRSPKKNTPRDTETTGQRPKFQEKGGFLTELGIDRLHPEPKNDFLGPGTPKNLQNPEKTKNKCQKLLIKECPMEVQ